MVVEVIVVAVVVVSEDEAEVVIEVEEEVHEVCQHFTLRCASSCLAIFLLT